MGSFGGYTQGRINFLREHSSPACWEKKHFQSQASTGNDYKNGRITKCLT